MAFCMHVPRVQGYDRHNNCRIPEVPARAGEPETTMANEKTPRGRAADRARVAGGQKHEVAYVAEKTGSSAGAVRKAAKRAGPSRTKVEAAVKKN